jgi:hypothetical protein
MSRRLLGLLFIAVAVSACGRYAAAPQGAAGYRLFLEEGYNDARQITVLDSGTGMVERQLPIGTPAPDWSRYYVVTGLAGSEKLSALDPATGRTIRQASIPAGFTLPSLGFQGPTAGLSPNGEWLVLTHQTGTMSSFLVGATSSQSPSPLWGGSGRGSFKTVQLKGDFSFDAVSNDGQSLYLIQKMGDPNHYQVRLYDVPSQSLTAQPVADKRESSEPMNGTRGDSVADPRGAYVFTVYARQAGPFIHALPLGQPYAWCLDLPAKNSSDIEEQFHWSLAVNRDGSELYAVNGSTGLIAEMSPSSLPKIDRTGHVALESSPGPIAGFVTNADAKGAAIGGAALAADGRTLFALGNTGIVAIDTSTLKVRTPILDGDSIESLRLSTDGRWLYAAGGGKLWQINPATGAAGQIRGSGSPWALLWAEPK